MYVMYPWTTYMCCLSVRRFEFDQDDWGPSRGSAQCNFFARQGVVIPFTTYTHTHKHIYHPTCQSRLSVLRKSGLIVVGSLVAWPSQGQPPSCAQHCCASQHLPYLWPRHPEVRCHCNYWRWGLPWVGYMQCSVSWKGATFSHIWEGARGRLQVWAAGCTHNMAHERTTRHGSTAACLHTHPHTARNSIAFRTRSILTCTWAHTNTKLNNIPAKLATHARQDPQSLHLSQGVSHWPRRLLSPVQSSENYTSIYMSLNKTLYVV